jgi:hypothetical protein
MNELLKTESVKDEAVPWLKGCEVCNAGLLKRMDELKERGLSEREAAREMEREAEQAIGEKVWDAGKIRNRYKYHKQGYGWKPTKGWPKIDWDKDDPDTIIEKTETWFQNRFDVPAEELARWAMSLRFYLNDGSTEDEVLDRAYWCAVSLYFRTLLDIACRKPDTIIDGRPISELVWEERDLVSNACEAHRSKVKGGA